jgi:hypothetical protein
MRPITITVSPTGRGDLLRAMLGDRVIVTSATPLFDSARVLLREGADPDAVLHMVWAGRPEPALSARLGEAALWTVRDNAYGTPVFRRYRPSRGMVSGPPVAPNDAAATPVADRCADAA